MRSPLPLILALSLVPPAVPAAGRAAGPPRVTAGTVELHSRRHGAAAGALKSLQTTILLEVFSLADGLGLV